MRFEPFLQENRYRYALQVPLRGLSSLARRRGEVVAKNDCVCEESHKKLVGSVRCAEGSFSTVELVKSRTD